MIEQTKERCLCGSHSVSVTHSLFQIDAELEKIEHAYHPNLPGVDNLLITARQYLEKMPDSCGIKVADLTQILDVQAERVGKWQTMREEEEYIHPDLGSEYEIANTIRGDIGKVWIEMSTRLSKCAGNGI